MQIDNFLRTKYRQAENEPALVCSLLVASAAVGGMPTTSSAGVVISLPPRNGVDKAGQSRQLEQERVNFQSEFHVVRRKCETAYCSGAGGKAVAYGVGAFRQPMV